MVVSDFRPGLDFYPIFHIMKWLPHHLADTQRFESKVWKEDSLIAVLSVPLRCLIEACPVKAVLLTDAAGGFEGKYVPVKPSPSHQGHKPVSHPAEFPPTAIVITCVL